MLDAKRSIHTVDLANMGGEDQLPLVQKGQTHAVGYLVCSRYAVGTQYAVGVSAKRSTPTVDLANIGGGDQLPLVQKGQTLAVGYAVHSRYAVCSRYAVHSRYTVCSKC